MRYSSQVSSIVLFAALIGLSAGVIAQIANASPSAPEPTGRRQILVWLRAESALPADALDGFGGFQARRLLAEIGPEFAARGLGRLQLVEVPAERAAAALATLRGHPDVASAEPNAQLHSVALPNDPLLGALWGLANAGQTGGTPGADIEAGPAWDLSDGSGTVVAVLDSGIDTGHPDLVGNLWVNPGEIPGNALDDDGNGYVDDVHGWDFFDGDGGLEDGSGHGTHIAGIIGAVADNGVGIAGVSHGTRIMALKIQGAAQIGTVAAAIEAIQYAIAEGADVLNNSWAVSEYWGEPGWDQPGFSPALEAAIQAAGDAGILFVVAAGNSSLDKDQILLFPGSYALDNMVVVAATDHDDALASWSNFGAETVHLAAPGVSIRSTVPASCQLLGAPPEGQSSCDGSGYLTASGTSMAAPHVTGVVALIRSRFPGLSRSQVKARLLYSAELLPGLVGNTISGGRLDAAAALATDPVGPGAISDLTVVSRDVHSLRVSWTATGDDGATGTARAYELRYSLDPIDAQNFGQAAAFPYAPLPGSAGTLEVVELTGLEPLTSYHLAVRAVDDVGNAGPLSNVLSAGTLSAGGCTDLVAFWRFEDVGGMAAIDASCNANGGALQNGPLSTQGTVGEAIDLDGIDDEVRIDDAALSDDMPGKDGGVTQSFTVAGWVRPAQAAYQILVAKDAAGERSFNLALRSDQLLEAQLFTGSTDIVLSNRTIPPAQWSHVALVCDVAGSRATLYVNGQWSGETPLSGTLDGSTADWVIGARAFGGSPNHYDGAIDELAVFESALGPGEILALQLPQCGNRLPELDEECDDGNELGFDGCSTHCRLTRSATLSGVADGGSVTLVVDGETLVVTTDPGQSATSVLSALASAILGNPTLQSLGTTAVIQNGTLVTNGLVTGFAIDDAGLSTIPSVAVPALSPLALLSTALLLIALTIPRTRGTFLPASN